MESEDDDEPDEELLDFGTSGTFSYRKRNILDTMYQTIKE